jgi:hypothetical protein
MRNQVDHVKSKGELHLPFQPSHMETRPKAALATVLEFKENRNNNRI